MKREDFKRVIDMIEKNPLIHPGTFPILNMKDEREISCIVREMRDDVAIISGLQDDCYSEIKYEDVKFIDWAY